MLRHLVRLTSSRNLRIVTKRFQGSLSILPNTALIDDPLTIKVQELEPRTPVTLHIHLKEGKIKYTSCAHYVTDKNGDCDLTKEPSVGGMYRGVEPMGLFWSMEAGPDEPWGRRLIKFDVTTPFKPVISVFKGHLNWKQCMEQYNKASPLARATCQRTYMGPGVTRHVIRHGQLRGTLFKPPGPGPFPAVVDLFGLIGGLVEFRAALLASRGIASLAVAYFNHDDLPPIIDRLDMDYFYQSIDFLQKQPYVRHDHGLGVIGVSQGGQVAALMATYFQEIKCCIMINSGIYNLLLSPYWKGWIGKHLTSLDELLQKGTLKPDGTVDCISVFKQFSLTHQTRVQIERSKARHLFMSGGADECVPPEASDLAAEWLEKGGNTNHEVLRLPGAGHLLEPPYSPLNPVIQCPNGKIASGGEKYGHAKSQEVAWKRILEFINETLNP